MAVSWCVLDWPERESGTFPGGRILTDANGDALRVTLGEGDVDCRPLYRVDSGDWIAKAIVAVEDGEFWTHGGVRPLSVLRAAWQNVVFGRRISGASTITMQAARLLRPHPKSYWGKYKEAVWALKMERAKDKDWILAQYLNRVPWGSNFVGVEAASQGWFGKRAVDLSLGEAALLAGMVQAPSRFRPDRNYARAVKRRDHVLDRMAKLSFASAGQIAAARAERPSVRRSPRPYKAPYFCDWALKRLAREERFPAPGRIVATSLDSELQARAERAVDAASAKGGHSVAAVILDAKTGGVRAMACSGNYFDRVNGQVNTATAARPAGSTLKPFLTAFALDRGLVTPEERLADVPRAFRGYRPANFDATHRGLVSVRDALVQSLNVPFVLLLRKMGLDAFGTGLRDAGFASISAPYDAYGLGLAIGNAEVSLVELTAAYAMFARGGVPCRPLAVPCAGEENGDADGEGGGVRPGTPPRVLSEGSSYLVSDMLSGDERSGAAFGHVADVPLPRFAWKTGTSSAYRDAWTVAWNPEWVVGVWCGHKYGKFGDETLVGAKVAAPVAMALARALYPGNDGPWFAEPEEVARRRVCTVTGLPAGPFCPGAETGRYLVGRSPNRPCDAHVRAPDGRIVERLDPLLEAFAGRTDKAEVVVISRPENDAVFCMLPGVKQQRVVCQVVGNPAGARLWWLMDGEVAGETLGLEPFVAEMTEGAHDVQCVTSSGVSSSVRFTVVPVP